MKKLLIGILIPFLLNARTDNEETRPKYRAGDLVKYVLPHFYSRVCRDVGTIERFDDTDGTYFVLTKWDGLKNGTMCPEELNIRENEILKVLN